MTSIVFTSLFLGLVLGTHPVGVAVWGPTASVERLRASLDPQQMLRVEGRHLPQEIVLSAEAREIEVLR